MATTLQILPFLLFNPQQPDHPSSSSNFSPLSPQLVLVGKRGEGPLLLLLHPPPPHRHLLLLLVSTFHVLSSSSHREQHWCWARLHLNLMRVCAHKESCVINIIKNFNNTCLLKTPVLTENEGKSLRRDFFFFSSILQPEKYVFSCLPCWQSIDNHAICCGSRSKVLVTQIH